MDAALMFNVKNGKSARKHGLEVDAERIIEFSDRNMLGNNVNGLNNLWFSDVLMDTIPQ